MVDRQDLLDWLHRTGHDGGAYCCQPAEGRGSARRPRLASGIGGPFPRRGRRLADTPQAVAEATRLFFTVAEPADVEAVALGPNGLLAGTKAGDAYFDLSTNSPIMVKKIEAVFAEKGAHMFDAPVSGGPRGAETGKLAIWVGGNERVYNQHKAVLGAMGDQGRATSDRLAWRPSPSSCTTCRATRLRTSLPRHSSLRGQGRNGST